MKITTTRGRARDRQVAAPCGFGGTPRHRGSGLRTHASGVARSSTVRGCRPTSAASHQGGRGGRSVCSRVPLSNSAARCWPVGRRTLTPDRELVLATERHSAHPVGAGGQLVGRARHLKYDDLARQPTGRVGPPPTAARLHTRDASKPGSKGSPDSVNLPGQRPAEQENKCLFGGALFAWVRLSLEPRATSQST